MIREIMKDEAFLRQKAEPVAKTMSRRPRGINLYNSSGKRPVEL